ncbi:hypothetical protein D9619_007721 [Psilocybe cf. subviscida]|uniref:Anaphase-promoting complex subunit 4 WD40 domain-containing protein n=1 Tax=Psilocybe cf. subviscida TaxID=2480587 RepID=A0A8H5AV28_9AGAR|nr:hypothetical protein D9619_007721 [Psilocybe cf. subviscida]
MSVTYLAFHTVSLPFTFLYHPPVFSLKRMLKALFGAYVLEGITFISLVIGVVIFITLYTSVPVGDPDITKRTKGQLEKPAEDEKESSESLASVTGLQDIPRTRKEGLTVRQTFEETTSDGGYVALVRSFLDSRNTSSTPQLVEREEKRGRSGTSDKFTVDTPTPRAPSAHKSELLRPVTPEPPKTPKTIAGDVETTILPVTPEHSRRVSSEGESNIKHKTSPVQAEGREENRPRHGSAEMEVDTDTIRPQSVPPSKTSLYNLTKAFRSKPQGPGDQITDKRSILLLSAHKAEVFVCSFNPKMHNLLASGSKDGVVHVWDLPHPPPSANTSEFAVGPGEPTVLENVLKDTQGDLTSLDWSPDGTLLAIGSYDTILRVCTRQGSIYFSHPQHQGPIFAARFSKNGAWLLTASLDGSTCLWDVKEKRLHKQYRYHKDCCLDVEWLKEDTFASAGADMKIFLMRIDENDAIKVLNGHIDEVNQIRVNSSGTRLASCSDDGTAYIWNVEDLGRSAETIPGLSTSEQVVLKGHNHSVSTVTWCVDHPEGTNELLVTSSLDSTVRLWDSVTGQCLHVFADHHAPLYSLTFSPDGKFIATGSGDGWLHVYHTRSMERIWSWYADEKQPGVFEIHWQEFGDVSRIALALECREVAVVDVNKVEAFRMLKNGVRHPAPPLDTNGSALWF